MTPRVLVTGGTGFIGRATVRALVATGACVHVASRHPGNLGCTDSQGSSGAAALHPIDLLDARATAGLVADIRPTHLVHLAWTTEHGRFWEDPANRNWLNASIALFDSFIEAGGRRIVAAGTCAEYDWTTPGPYAETSPTRPATLYGTSKLRCAEALETLAGRSTRVGWCWARLFHLYGPGEAPARLVPGLIDAALRGTSMELRKPDNIVDLMHVDDVGRAMAHLTDHDGDGVVNVASGSATRLGDLADTVNQLCGITRRRDVLGQDDVQCISADVTRLSDLGFTPSIPLIEGLRATSAARRASLEQDGALLEGNDERP